MPNDGPWEYLSAAIPISGMPQLWPENDIIAPPPDTAIDKVIRDLGRDLVAPKERGRLGKALGDANARADGPKSNNPFVNAAKRSGGGVQEVF